VRSIAIVCIIFFISSCSREGVEEFSFRKTLEITLIDLCGKEDKECISAVKSQVGTCMKKSNWKRYLDNEEIESEKHRFMKEFYSCITDDNGTPYFDPNL
jgi:hypothetical protein